MAPTTIEKQVLKWPAARRVALAEKLLESVTDFSSGEIAETWEREIKRRTTEIEKGEAAGIPSEEVIAKARAKLSEARPLPQARRKRIG